MDSEDTVILTKSTIDGVPMQNAALPIPRTLGPVRLIRQIGAGGMGAVWLGRHEILGRDVAVKFLLNIVTSEDDPHFVQFIEGAKAAAALRHPGLNIILDANVEQRVPYLVMEYIDGPPLHVLMRSSGPVPGQVAAAIIGAVCEPIAVLHDHGVVHRDIKPANILVSLDGRAVVTDFGLSCFRALAGDDGVGASRAVAGTPPYMAPEMFDGAITPRTDVYALGIMAYELLAGRRPFDGNVSEVERRHRQDVLPREPLLSRGVPEPLCEVLERATHKNPMFRYKTARHFAEGLVNGLPHGVRPRTAEDVLSRLIAGQKLGGSTPEGSAAATPMPTPDAPQSPGLGSATPLAGDPGAYYDKISTLADVKRRSAPTPIEVRVEPGLGSEAAAVGARCRRCGHAVLPHHSEFCPECGMRLPVAGGPGAPGGAVGSGELEVVRARQGEAQRTPPRPRESPRRRPRFRRWAVCLPIAAAAGTLAAVGLDGLAYTLLPGRTIEESARAGGWTAAIGAATLLLVGFPSVLFACFVFARLVPPLPRDFITRCGGCGHALSGLREPKCPECGRVL